MALYGRALRRRYLHRKSIFITILFILFLDGIFIASHSPTPVRSSSLPSALRHEKIFIASIHRNSEYVLRLYWNSALVRLVEALGPQNVFVSILESGSQENTKAALQDLKGKLDLLGVENFVSLGVNHTQQMDQLKHAPAEGKDRTGWIETGRALKWEKRRIPYLSDLRNKAMEPLLEMKDRKKFDRVLWINDVVFNTEDIMTLLSTRGGSYAAACSLDFGNVKEYYYDTFALRDALGQKTASLRYPYFQNHLARTSLFKLEPIPVQSCWNGIVSFDSSPFYALKPLKFRGVPDSLAVHHVEGSECCLIHSDNQRLRSEKGVWLNPNVRVSYNAEVYSYVNGGIEIKPDMKGEDYPTFGTKAGNIKNWPRKWERVEGIWVNRLKRLAAWGSTLAESKTMRSRVEKWEKEEGGRKEKGLECLVNEMQVMYQNGWQHV